MKKYLSRSLGRDVWQVLYRQLRTEAKQGKQSSQHVLVYEFSPVPDYQWLSFSRFARWEMRGAW